MEIPFDDEDEQNQLAMSAQTRASTKLVPGLGSDGILDNVVEETIDFEESDYESEIGDN